MERESWGEEFVVAGAGMASTWNTCGKTAVTSLPPSMKRMRVKIPKVKEHFVALLEDLEKMGYAGLLDKPWSFKD